MAAAKETEIQAAICDYLALKGYLFWRMNVIPAVYVDRHGERQFRRLPKYTMKGLPDIALVHPVTGRFYGIEVKAEIPRPPKGMSCWSQKDISVLFLQEEHAY